MKRVCMHVHVRGRFCTHVHAPEQIPVPIVSGSGIDWTDRCRITVRTTPSGAAYMQILNTVHVRPRMLVCFDAQSSGQHGTPSEPAPSEPPSGSE